MKEKFLVLGIFCFLSFFYSCETSEDYYYNLDKNPEIRIKTFLQDSFKINIVDSNKIGKIIKLDISTEINNSVSILQILGKDSIILDKTNISILSLETGESNFVINVKDNFGKTNTAFLTLINFLNLKPIACLNVSQNQNFDKYEVSISAKNSYDADQKYGGKIINYHYRINNNYDIITKLDTIDYIFSTIGIKQIFLSVQDNDSVWSKEVNKNIYIN